VRPFWESRSQEERVQLLTIDINDLRERAVAVNERMQKQAGAQRGSPMYGRQTGSNFPILRVGWKHWFLRSVGATALVDALRRMEMRLLLADRQTQQWCRRRSRSACGCNP
jgi:hypothetical protein